MKFDDILEKLESDGEILNYRFHKSQIPMYLVIRFSLIQSLINKEFDLSNPHVQNSNRTIKENLTYIYHTLKSNLFFAPKKDIYIFSSDILNILDGDKYKNRLHNDLYNLYIDKSQIFEISTNYTYKEPKYNKVYFIDLIPILREFLSIFFRKIKQDILEIEELIFFINKRIGLDENQVQNLERILRRFSLTVDIECFFYKLFIKIKKPKVLILDCAHYGVYIPLILAAKKFNIKIVEYQHGYIGLAHPAYNYHKNIFQTIKKYLPEYFLTHGKYWSNVARTPSKKIPIGLASLSKNIDKISKVEKQGKSILFISGGTVYKTLNALIKKSLINLQELGYTVLLRPHPSEFPAIQERYSSLIDMGVQIDAASLYSTLKEADIVIGMEVSTVLYEAICFTNKVYLMDTIYTTFYEPKSYFLLFKNEKELLDSIKEKRTLNYEASFFWDNNWEKNYKNFIKRIKKN